MTAFQSLLNNTFTNSRLRRTPDGRGGWQEDYVQVGTFRGRLRPSSATELLAAAQLQRSTTHVLYCEYGVDIQRGDVVEGGGLEVNVDGVREPSTAHEHLEVDCSAYQVEATVAEEPGS